MAFQGSSYGGNLIVARCPIYSLANVKGNLAEFADVGAAVENVAIARHAKVVAYARVLFVPQGENLRLTSLTSSI